MELTTCYRKRTNHCYSRTRDDLMNILRQDSCCSTLTNNQVNGFMYLDHINQLRMLIHGPYIKRHAIKLAGIKLHRTFFV